MASDDGRFERGVEMIRKVYAGDVVTPPKGAMDFSDQMLEHLFGEIWAREDRLSIRERRLLIMGVIGALGEKDTWKIQAKAALKNGELDEAQLRELVITLAHYAGYPRAAGILSPTEAAIAEVAQERAADGDA